MSDASMTVIEGYYRHIYTESGEGCVVGNVMCGGVDLEVMWGRPIWLDKLVHVSGPIKSQWWIASVSSAPGVVSGSHGGWFWDGCSQILGKGWGGGGRSRFG